jgi:RHS repeat-associated protein
MEYTFTGQMSYMDDPITNETTEGFGLMFFNARWLDPAIGRFAQADSIVPESQGVQAWDRYAFVNNNPLRYTDPSGHWINFAIGAAVGAIIGGGSYAIGAAISGNFDSGQFVAATAMGTAGGLLVATGIGAATGSAMIAAAVTGAGVGAITAEAAYNITAGENYNTTDMMIATGVGAVAGAANGAIGVTSIAGTTTGLVAETAVNGAAGSSQHLLTSLHNGASLDGNLLLESAGVGLLTAGTTGMVDQLLGPLLPSQGSQVATWAQIAKSPYLSKSTTTYIIKSYLTRDALNGIVRGTISNISSEEMLAIPN